jgi:SAM-dependent methyltransferase
LEVGCGSGEFLHRAAAAGHHIRGIELNPGAVAAARARGLACEQRDLADLAATSPGTFDAVCSFQVLEHVAHPRAFITDCVRLLRPGGALILSVPDADGWIRLKDFLLDLPPHHMLGWSEQSLRALGPQFGLSVERMLFEPLPTAQIENYLSAQRARWRNPAIRRLLFNRFTQPVMAAVLRTSVLPLRGQSMLAIFRLNSHE